MELSWWMALLFVALGSMLFKRSADFRTAFRGPATTLHALVLTGSYGAGHDRAAGQIARTLTAAGYRVDVVDVVEEFPMGFGKLLKRVYFAQLNACPITWEWTLRLLSRRSRVSGQVSRPLNWLLGRLPARRLLKRIRPETTMVVSTHPFASAALGLLRRTGQLEVPAITYLTDASVHALWIHEGVDQHLALYGSAQAQAEALGAADVRLIRPLVPTAAPLDQVRRARLREAAGIPATGPVAFVVGGSEGVGELVHGARDVAASGLVVPVVACGRNEKLAESLAQGDGLIPLGWVDNLAELISTGDVVVQNGGGFTVLESLAAGLPVISYRPLAGHGVASAWALEEEGLARFAHDPAELAQAIAGALAQGRRTPEVWAQRPTFNEVLGVVPVVSLTA